MRIRETIDLPRKDQVQARKYQEQHLRGKVAGDDLHWRSTGLGRGVKDGMQPL
jgi:hypothetical protein